ncbi:MAG: RNA polymerase sigma factor [Thermodesulfobacteriota bacterium]|nr:RNA polymerase sigma factor [Thermodesulfobacteriota bacterium]
MTESFDAFYEENKEKLFSYLMRVTGDYELSRDVMQESFTRCLEHYGFKDMSASLLYTVARNALWDRIRKRGRRASRFPGGEKTAIDQEAYLMIRDEYRRVLEAMMFLAEDERDLLALVVGGDLTYKQIAAITGLSVPNVKVKVHRARRSLAAILDGG